MEPRGATLVWVDNYSAAIYPIDIESDPTCTFVHQQKQPMKSLVEICCNYIVRDAQMTLHTIKIVPDVLYHPMMREALSSNKDRAMEVLLSNWKREGFCLKNYAPKLFSSPLMLYNENYRSEVIRHGMRYTTILVHSLIKSLKSGISQKLKYLDLTGYPLAEVVLFYLSTQCQLAYNECRRKALVQKFNEAALRAYEEEDQTCLDFGESSFPLDKRLIVKMDAFITSESTFSEMCKALKISTFCESKVQLCLHRLGAIQLGAPAVNLLLRQINPEHLVALQLHYNSFTCDDFVTLIPALKMFTNLTSLDVACNNLNFSTNLTPSMQIAECLGSLPKLTRLDLSNNRVKCCLRMLVSRINEPLEFLCLSSSGLRLNDLTYLSISHHASGIRELDLSSNGFNGCAEVLCKLLDALTNLKIIELEDCSLGFRDLDKIQKSLVKLQNLLYIDIADNPFNVPDITSFIKTITSNHSIACVRLSYPLECYMDDTEHLYLSKAEFVHNIQQTVNSVSEETSRRKRLQLVFVELTDIEMMDGD